MDKEISYKKSRSDKFNGKAPLLFTIPLDVYSDELEKDRDKDYYLKIQELEKRCQQIRANFHQLLKRHSLMIQSTLYLVSVSEAVKNNHISRKLKYRH